MQTYQSMGHCHATIAAQREAEKTEQWHEVDGKAVWPAERSFAVKALRKSAADALLPDAPVGS